MAAYDFRAPRLYVDHPLEAGAELPLDAGQTNYLRNVLRLGAGDQMLVFNGRDGEWRATLAERGKRALSLTTAAQSRPQTQPLDLHYWFAPLKHARLDYMVQKAVEMGVGRLQPVLTQHGQIARLNLERMRANAIEAAEQCGILTLPEIAAPLRLERAIAERDPARLLVFCDEDAEVADPLAALGRRKAAFGPDQDREWRRSPARIEARARERGERVGDLRVLVAEHQQASGVALGNRAL